MNTLLISYYSMMSIPSFLYRPLHNYAAMEIVVECISLGSAFYNSTREKYHLLRVISAEHGTSQYKALMDLHTLI